MGKILSLWGYTKDKQIPDGPLGEEFKITDRFITIDDKAGGGKKNNKKK